MNENRLRSLNPLKAWSMLGLASLFYMYVVILRVSPTVMTNELMSAFHVSSFQLGFLASCFYYAYVFLQVPCGVILDKLGVRKLVTISALVASFGTFLFAYADSLLIAGIGRFLIGSGSACGFISCLKVGMEWFPAKQFALIPGIVTMIGTLGGTCAGRPLAIIVSIIGWTDTMLVLSILGALIAAICWFFLRDSKSFHGEKYPPLKKTLKLFFSHPKLLLIGTVGGLMYLPISVFAELWGIPFLMNVYHINKELASTISTMVFIGVAFGGPSFAIFRRNIKWENRSIMQLASFIAALLFIGVAFAEDLSLWTTVLFLFGIGFCIGAESLCFAWAKDLMPINVGGTAVAFTNALVMLIGAIFQPIIGGVLDFFWDGKIDAKGIPIYTANCYNKAILTIPLCLLISFFLLLIMKRYEYKQSN